MKKKFYNYAIKELSANFSGTSQLHGTDEQCMELNEGGMRIFSTYYRKDTTWRYKPWVEGILVGFPRSKLIPSLWDEFVSSCDS